MSYSQMNLEKYTNCKRISDFKCSKEIFVLLELEESEDENVRVIDENIDNNIILIHYIIPTENNRNIRGVIIDIEKEDNPRICCPTFSFTQDLDINDEKVKNIDFTKDLIVSNAGEGTILRMFYKNQWFISTFKKIDGTRSRWSGGTFGDSFYKAWGDVLFKDILNTGCAYSFLLSDPSTRLACKIDTLKLTLVAIHTIFANKMIRCLGIKILNDNVIDNSIYSVNSYEELNSLVSRLDWQDTTGLLIIDPENTRECIKVLAPGYLEKRNIRGSQPNLSMRYYEMMKLGTQQELLDLYPEYTELFNNCKENYNKLPSYLESFYKIRYIDKKFLKLPQEQFYVLRNVHTEYDFNETLEENIRTKLLGSNPRQINAMIKQMNGLVK